MKTLLSLVAMTVVLSSQLLMAAPLNENVHVTSQLQPVECDAIIWHNSQQCRSWECKAIIENNPALCRSNICLAIVERNHNLCYETKQLIFGPAQPEWRLPRH